MNTNNNERAQFLAMVAIALVGWGIFCAGILVQGLGLKFTCLCVARVFPVRWTINRSTKQKV
jgi:hypothetical protein